MKMPWKAVGAAAPVAVALMIAWLAYPPVQESLCPLSPVAGTSASALCRQELRNVPLANAQLTAYSFLGQSSRRTDEFYRRLGPEIRGKLSAEEWRQRWSETIWAEGVSIAAEPELGQNWFLLR
ncbi:hypothetical protein GCM10009858_44550 [Terrabacter carboxydivorans]|uniref:Uncharacterized protein n=1 Tax=Terrabacter carboxydivorans TaxID=619730 RepID=A0ABP5ZQ61_9MICO